VAEIMFSRILARNDIPSGLIDIDNRNVSIGYECTISFICLELFGFNYLLGISVYLAVFAFHSFASGVRCVKYTLHRG
jgi:hypothetical protein